MGCDPDEECSGISILFGGKDLLLEVLQREGSSVVRDVDKIRTDNLDVPILTGVRLGMDGVILVCGNQNHK